LKPHGRPIKGNEFPVLNFWPSVKVPDNNSGNSSGFWTLAAKASSAYAKTARIPMLQIAALGHIAVSAPPLAHALLGQPSRMASEHCNCAL
jgi:hypothetical protein